MARPPIPCTDNWSKDRINSLIDACIAQGPLKNPRPFQGVDEDRLRYLRAYARRGGFALDGRPADPEPKKEEPAQPAPPDNEYSLGCEDYGGLVRAGQIPQQEHADQCRDLAGLHCPGVEVEEEHKADGAEDGEEEEGEAGH